MNGAGLLPRRWLVLLLTGLGSCESGLAHLAWLLLGSGSGRDGAEVEVVVGGWLGSTVGGPVLVYAQVKRIVGSIRGVA